MKICDIQQAKADLLAINHFCTGHALDSIAGRYGILRMTINESHPARERDGELRLRVKRHIDAELAKISADVAEIETGYGEETRPSFYAEVRPDGHTGVSVAQAMVDVRAMETLSGHDLDHIAKRYGIERDGAEADYWFRVRIQRKANEIIMKARYWIHEPMPEMPTPSGREVFEREHLTKIETKRYTLEEAFAIICQGIHPASFMRESGRSPAQAVGVLDVVFSMMRRNIDKAGGK